MLTSKEREQNLTESGLEHVTGTQWGAGWSEFSPCRCGGCGTQLAGERWAAVGTLQGGEWQREDAVCTDCVLALANGVPIPCEWTIHCEDDECIGCADEKATH